MSQFERNMDILNNRRIVYIDDNQYMIYLDID